MLINKGTIFGILILLLPASTLFGGIFSFYDELFVLLVVICGVLFNRNNIDRKLLYIFILILALGFISNIRYPIYPSFRSVLVDAFTLFKPFWVLIFLPGCFDEKQKRKAYKIFLPLAQVYIITAFLFGILSQFVDLGMTSGHRYGIKAYYFLFNNHSGFGISIIASILILSASYIRNYIFGFYFILASIILFFTTKGVMYSFLLVSWVLFSIRSNSFKIKTWHIIFLGTAIAVISSFQIKTYFMDSESARMVFIYSSLVLATEFFPFGTGFATFGGKEAYENYSVLYERFGFSNIWGLSKANGMFAYDNYMAGIIAQVGFIGYLLFLILLWLIFKRINSITFQNKRLKITILAALFMLYVSSIATGIIKTDNGVFLVSIISVLLPIENKPFPDHIESKKNNITY